MAYLQVSSLGGSRDETWRGQTIRKRSVSWNLPQNWVNCDGATEVSDQAPHRTTYGQNSSWVVHEILAEWLPVRCETNRLTVCGRNLITGLTSAASPRVDISSTCKVGQKLGVSLPLLTRSPSAWPSRLLYRRGWKSRRDLWITLYIILSVNVTYYN